MLAIQLITLLQKIHDKGIIHRDVKPENILMGRKPQENVVFIVDFGISKYYLDNFNKHIVFKTQKPFIGTCRYASISSHLGQELSRKDDMESLGYVLVFLSKGKLPWQNLNRNEKDKIKKVGKMKQSISLKDLCYDMPKEFLMYFIHVKSLGFHQRPKYEYLLELFVKMLEKKNMVYDYQWDWLNKQERSRLQTLSMFEVNKSEKENKKHNSFVLSNSPTTIKEKNEEIFQRITRKKLSNFLEPPKSGEIKKKKEKIVIKRNVSNFSGGSFESLRSGSGSASSLNNKYIPSLLADDEIKEDANENELREYLGKNMRQMVKEISKKK